MKTIVIDNIEYNLVPKKRYTTGNWVVYGHNNAIRRIVDDNSYIGKIEDDQRLNNIYGEWLTEYVANEWEDHIKRLAQPSEISRHLNKLARSKGFGVGRTVPANEVSGSFINVISDDNILYNTDVDKFYMGGVCIYDDGKWASIEKGDNLYFGGKRVEIVKTDTGILISCEKVTGTLEELENIINNPIKVCRFGQVNTVKWGLKGEAFLNEVDINAVSDFSNIIAHITIGCLRGTYQELIKIREAAKNLKDDKAKSL